MATLPSHRGKQSATPRNDPPVDVYAANSTASAFLGRRKPNWMRVSPHEQAVPPPPSSDDALSSPEPERISPRSPAPVTESAPATSVTAPISAAKRKRAQLDSPHTQPSQDQSTEMESSLPQAENGTARTEPDSPSPTGQALTLGAADGLKQQQQQHSGIAQRPPSSSTTLAASPVIIDLINDESRSDGSNHQVFIEHSSGATPNRAQAQIHSTHDPGARSALAGLHPDHQRPPQLLQYSLQGLRDLFHTHARMSVQNTAQENQQMLMIHRACQSSPPDYFILALHQTLCAKTFIRLPNITGWPAREAGMNLLTPIMVPSVHLGTQFLFRWAHFPRPLDVAGTDAYAQSVASLGSFAEKFASSFPDLTQKCVESDRPPLFADIFPDINSVLFKKMVFMTILRNMWPGLSEPIWKNLMTVYEHNVTLHRNNEYTPTQATMLMDQYTSIAAIYRGTCAEESRPAAASTAPGARRPRGRPRKHPASEVPHAPQSSAPPMFRVPEIAQLQRSILPGPNVTLDQPAVPDPTMYGLHVSHLREKPIAVARSSSSAISSFQYISDFLMLPRRLDQTSYVIACEFDLPVHLSDNRVSQDEALYEGALPVQRAVIGSCRLRLQCKQSDATQDMSEWISCKTHWPSLSLFKCNSLRIEPPRKWQFGVGLPSDITALLHAGKNDLAVYNLAGKAQRQLGRQTDKYAFAVEIVTVTSTVEIQQQVLATVRPASECLVAILGTSNDDGDDEVISTRTIISLKDPILGGRMWETPVRGKTCKHKDAFDLTAFLESVRLGKSDDEPSGADGWRCPICRADARPNMLVADGWLISVRDELVRRSRLDALRIEVSEQGTWQIAEDQPHQPSNPERGARRSDAKAKTITVEVVEIDD